MLIFIIKIVVTPFIVLVFSALFYNIYIIITDPHKLFFKNSNLRNLFRSNAKRVGRTETSGIHKNLIFEIILILTIILLLYFIPFDFGLGYSNFIFDLISIILLLFVPSILILFYSKGANLLHDPIEYAKRIFSLMLPLIISVISLFVLIEYTIGISTIIDFSSILNFQLNNSIQFLYFRIPALFVFLNPFATLSFLVSTMGIIRYNRMLEFDVNGYKFSKIHFLINQLSFFAIISMITALFFGGGYYFGQDLLLNVFLFIVYCLILTLLISYLDYGRPIVKVEKNKINLFKNFAFIFSMTSLVFSFIIVSFDLPFIELNIYFT